MFSRIKNLYHYLLALVGAFIYRNPSRELVVIGITGTKGKTTSVELLHAVLQAAGRKTAMLSSASIAFGDQLEPRSGNTMPGRFFIQKFLRQAVNAGCQYAVFEVTSQGVVQHRHRFIDFDVAAITCLHPEHIESHGGYERYRGAKVKFFRDTAHFSAKPDKKFFINSDMATGGDAQFFEQAVRPYLATASSPRQQPDLVSTRSDDETAGLPRLGGNDKVISKSGAVPKGSASFAQSRRYANEQIEPLSASSSRLEPEANEARTRGEGSGEVGSWHPTGRGHFGEIVHYSRRDFLSNELGGDKQRMSSWLQGDFNMENAALVFSIAHSLGVSKETILKVCKEFTGVAGRLEFIRPSAGSGQVAKAPTVVIDYALTPGSLRAVYAHLKTLLKPGGKLIAVFGSAGGGRDTWKRPELGKIADEFCERIYLTTDDSYDEKTEDIIAEIQEGIFNTAKCSVIIDRGAAITEALRSAGSEDIVAITGMGSQMYTYGPRGKKTEWSDRKAVERALESL